MSKTQNEAVEGSLFSLCLQPVAPKAHPVKMADEQSYIMIKPGETSRQIAVCEWLLSCPAP